jgi:signal transduction histidine kinase
VGKGTGLGLSIVYTIIENHKGTLEVSTEQGKGTNFIITLPIYQNAQQND